MKTLITFAISLITFIGIAQSKKIEITNSETGKTVYFEENQRVKVTLDSRKRMVGTLTITDASTIAIDGQPFPLESVLSLKNYPKKGRTAKNILLGTGLGLIAGSGVAAATGSGVAFSLFAAGTGTTIIGGLVNNKNKNYLKRRNIFKIIE
jgi:hypothetical protein